MTKERKPHWTEIAGFFLLGFLILGCFFLYAVKVEASYYPNQHSTSTTNNSAGLDPYYINLGNGWSGSSTQVCTVKNEGVDYALWLAYATTSDYSHLCNTGVTIYSDSTDNGKVSCTDISAQNFAFDPNNYYTIRGVPNYYGPNCTFSYDPISYNYQGTQTNYATQYYGTSTDAFTPYLDWGTSTIGIHWIAPSSTDSIGYDFQFWKVSVTDWDASRNERIQIVYWTTGGQNMQYDNNFSYTNQTSTEEEIQVYKFHPLALQKTGFLTWYAQAQIWNREMTTIIDSTPILRFKIRYYDFLTDYYGGGITTSTNGYWEVIQPPNASSGVEITVHHCLYPDMTNCDQTWWDSALNIISRMSSYPPLGYIYTYIAKFQDLKQGTSSYATVNLTGALDPILSPIRTGITAALWIGFAVYVVRRVKYMAT